MSVKKIEFVGVVLESFQISILGRVTFAVGWWKMNEWSIGSGPELGLYRTAVSEG